MSQPDDIDSYYSSDEEAQFGNNTKNKTVAESIGENSGSDSDSDNDDDELDLKDPTVYSDNEDFEDKLVKYGGSAEDESDDELNYEKENVTNINVINKTIDVNKNDNDKEYNTIIIDEDVVDDDDSSDDDDDDENYLQKFKKELTNKYVAENHPQCLHHNYDEIKMMSKVIRNSDNIIIDPYHKTLPYLTKYEKTRILGQRSKQIESGAQPLVKIPENVIDSYIIAELELAQRKIPFIVKRPLPNGAFEYWNLKDLEIINF
jgi:DNA-directed RNA polymerase I, II, and III subunit RPABC2